MTGHLPGAHLEFAGNGALRIPGCQPGSPTSSGCWPC